MERNRSWNRNRNGNSSGSSSSNLPHVAGCCRRSRIKLSRLTERKLAPRRSILCGRQHKKSWINIERSRKRQLDQERERDKDRWQKTAFTVALADVVAVAIDIARLGDVVVVYSCSLIFKRKGKLPTSTTSSGRHTNCASNWCTLPLPRFLLKRFLQSASKNNIRFFFLCLAMNKFNYRQQQKQQQLLQRVGHHIHNRSWVFDLSIFPFCSA